MAKTSLVIMAAGIGSRFGKGVKQLTPVGPNGELIMDYSVYDALQAGFDRVIFIIRQDLEQEFRELIGDRVAQICPVEYVFQELTDLPEGYSLPEGRTKPWGTGQAVLACADLIDGPFAVINADDYYGKEAYRLVHNFLINHADEPGAYCMAGFVLKNTLSENGTVTRGICRTDAQGYLTGIEETKNIEKTADGAKTGDRVLDTEACVSMNMWGFSAEFVRRLRAGFVKFLDDPATDPFKGEYLLPIYIDELLRAGEITVRVERTNDRWFGVTYAEDRAAVARSIARMTEAGDYPTPLNRSYF